MVVSPRWPVRAGRRVRGSLREWPNSRPARRRCGAFGHPSGIEQVFGYQNRLGRPSDWILAKLCRPRPRVVMVHSARRSDVVELGRLDQSWSYLDRREPLTRDPAGNLTRFGERALVRKRAHPATYPRVWKSSQIPQSHSAPCTPWPTRKLALLPNTFVEIAHVTLTPQEPIPGTSCSSVAFMPW